MANVDRIFIVTSAAEPTIKPNLIDRFLITAQQNLLDACIVINKCDLIDPAELQTMIGTYAQMGYEVLMASASKGWGMQRLKSMLVGRQSVVVGQSGVGKSSILNAIEPGLQQRVQAVSAENQKGKHTTTTAEVFPLACGGSIVDTPGIRQFQLYDIAPKKSQGSFAICDLLHPTAAFRIALTCMNPIARSKMRSRIIDWTSDVRQLLPDDRRTW